MEYQAIKEELEISDEALKSALHCLCHPKIQILKKETKSPVFEQNEKIKINLKFKDPNEIVKLNLNFKTSKQGVNQKNVQ